ncbi:YifB family Mg chelatase-like AAA ATPase [Chondromyces crocatus]|uniref:Magnesium chelatase n=1 Tax=Chondromyces crocatus TaxID=52 RepID=A0A0K1EF81_CHOCO|nr:YifB family Mg chelatase-like AAA ATPase [Chondromyces crocatus]AKT39228.1 magnesium chelatase [Chondromyces crocatus]
MQAAALTFCLVGLDAFPIRVEVDSGRGPACFQMVGLPEASVRESRVRVRAALQQVNVELNEYVITVNLAPADVRKSGGAYDLAIAAATLAALRRIPAEALSQVGFLGELSLSGAVQPVRGVLAALRGAAARGVRRVIVPRGNAREAASVRGIEVGVVSHLKELLPHLGAGKPLDGPGEAPSLTCDPFDAAVDLADVRGQHAARRALEVAAAGGHNLLLVGPPGSGKTLLSRRLPTVLPPLTFEEALEVTAIHSVAGLLPADKGFIASRPFRAPHHTVSVAGLVGGGDPVRPGEVSLAHHGCLFLDELLEFRRGATEALRQPLEEGEVTLCRARARVTFPARPLLLAATNPCPCGFAGDRLRRCSCSVERVRAYRAKLSGPLLDRMDLHVAMPPVEVSQICADTRGESSAVVRARVMAARAVQRARFEGGEASALVNTALGPRDLARVAAPDAEGERLLRVAVERLGLSARAYGKVLRVARTLADLAGSDAVRSAQVAEAIGMRLLDREASVATAVGAEA